MDENKSLELVKLFFKDKGLARQQIESFNYFIEHDIENIVKANDIVDSDIDHTFYLKYTDVKIGMPSIEENMLKHTIYPVECRLRDLTYASNVYVDIEYVRNKQIIKKKDVFLGKIPIMLKSCRCYLNKTNNDLIQSMSSYYRKLYETQECPYDIGGYFIVKGVERVILIQEQLAKNRIIIENGPKGCYSSITSSTHEQKSKTSVTYKNDCFYIKNSIFTDEVPIIAVIKACGIVQDKDIVGCIGSEFSDLISLSFEEVNKNSIFTARQALIYLAEFIKMKPDENKIEVVRNVLVEKILPNISYHGCDLRNKGIVICLMVRRLMLTQKNIVEEEDKDFMGNKRFELAGQLLSILFEDTFKKFNWELKRSIDKILSKRSRAQEFDAMTFFSLQTNIITSSMSRAITTGNWNLKRFRMDRSGVTHVLLRHSYISAVGMMTKVNSHFEKTRKVSGPRSLHTSSWGMLCPADTPEGESCGLVKNLSLLAEITTDCDIAPIISLLAYLGVIETNLLYPGEIHKIDTYVVFLNGDIFGVSTSPYQLVKNFRIFRRRGVVDKYVSIYIDDKQKSINISADNGRICRPLIIFDKNNAISSIDLRYKSFDDLIKEGKIEYLDANEENDTLIAIKQEDISENTTHIEIADFAILGYVAGLIPFPNHNQSPRNTYQCAMGKQAIGYIALNSKKRFDGIILQLCNTQRPLTTTQILNITDYNNIPAGQNAMVAVMSYSGYDIEDALILNKDSLDRGFARTEVYKTHCFSIKKYSDNRSDVLLPDENNKVLDNDGIGKPGELLTEGTVFINKRSPSEEGYKFAGGVHKGLPAYIDRVIITKCDDQTLIKITLRQTRIPEIGDKFSSRHGQKGVVGLIVPQVDMPFNDQGLVPDIIMNPHGFPSRMTVGKIIELITGKAGLIEGKISDSTVFKKNEVELACETLVKNGFNYGGKDCFYSGQTGEPIHAYVYYGPVFYQRLKHMVADKIHMRARGPRAILTRQPTEGRSKDGGLRLGEMERDCLIGYGASSLIIERLMESSDAFDTFVCKQCGILVSKEGCNVCKNLSPAPIRLPYACKLLFQELMSMNILPKIDINLIITILVYLNICYYLLPMKINIQYRNVKLKNEDILEFFNLFSSETDTINFEEENLGSTESNLYSETKLIDINSNLIHTNFDSENEEVYSYNFRKEIEAYKDNLTPDENQYNIMIFQDKEINVSLENFSEETVETEKELYLTVCKFIGFLFGYNQCICKGFTVKDKEKNKIQPNECIYIKNIFSMQIPGTLLYVKPDKKQINVNKNLKIGELENYTTFITDSKILSSLLSSISMDFMDNEVVYTLHKINSEYLIVWDKQKNDDFGFMRIERDKCIKLKTFLGKSNNSLSLALHKIFIKKQYAKYKTLCHIKYMKAKELSFMGEFLEKVPIFYDYRDVLRDKLIQSYNKFSKTRKSGEKGDYLEIKEQKFVDRIPFSSLKRIFYQKNDKPFNDIF